MDWTLAFLLLLRRKEMEAVVLGRRLLGVPVVVLLLRRNPVPKDGRDKVEVCFNLREVV
jgi:hypothetical protein